MISEKMSAILELLSRLTLNKRMKWQETESAFDDVSFIAPLKEHTINLGMHERSNSDPVITLSILKDDGKQVERIDTETADPYARLTLQTLYDNARRQVLGVDEELDAIIEELHDKEPPF